jgi:hypothetical protein
MANPMVSSQKAYKLEQERRKERAVELYAQGHSYRKVAALLADPEGKEPGPSHVWVKRVIDGALRGLQARMDTNLDAWRTKELTKLAALESTIAAKVTAGDLKAVLVSLRISERRARLLGLDAPVSVDGQIDVTVSPEISVRIEAARLAVAEQEQQLRLLPAGDVVDAEVLEEAQTA